MYTVEGTGDTGEPCGVPTIYSKGSDILPLNLSLTVWSFRKDLHHLTSSSANPKSVKIFISRSWLILLKYPWISKSNIPVFSLTWWADWMSWRMARPASKVDVRRSHALHLLSRAAPHVVH